MNLYVMRRLDRMVWPVHNTGLYVTFKLALTMLLVCEQYCEVSTQGGLRVHVQGATAQCVSNTLKCQSTQGRLRVHVQGATAQCGEHYCEMSTQRRG